MSKSQSLLLDPHLFSEEQQRASTSSSTLPDGPTARPDDDEGGFMGRIGARGIGAMTGAFTTSLLSTSLCLPRPDHLAVFGPLDALARVSPLSERARPRGSSRKWKRYRR